MFREIEVKKNVNRFPNNKNIGVYYFVLFEGGEDDHYEKIYTGLYSLW